jgi:hypothetical protein
LSGTSRLTIFAQPRTGVWTPTCRACLAAVFCGSTAGLPSNASSKHNGTSALGIETMRTTEVVTALSIAATEEELVIRLANREVRVPWDRCSPILAAATADERRRAELSPGGYGIHWPMLDEDLSIGGLVK